ncbi:hypothetical protein DL96DRAFT_1575118 [Flagelloscypha sp. PMI_526]|nr:hypothetical protein DL96DRAFT_1575118 [Flagelloscypha sp. PMI_526]
MFARLSVGSSRLLLDTSLENVPSSSSSLSKYFGDDDDQIAIDSWNGIRSLYEKAMSPVTEMIHDFVLQDMTHLEAFIASLDAPRLPPFNDTPTQAQESEPLHTNSRISKQFVMTIFSSSSSGIPDITVTLCEDDVLSASLVPHQDSGFGTRLLIPGRHAFNASFPPMLTRPPTTPPHTKWDWNPTNGHWEASLPPPELRTHARVQPSQHLGSRNNTRLSSRGRGKRRRSFPAVLSMNK